MVSPATKRKQNLMRQAQAAANRRRAQLKRANALLMEVVATMRRNAVPAHLKPIKISAKRK
jgi:hypothetical protein